MNGETSAQMAPEGPAPDFRALFEAVSGLYLVLTPTLRIVAASEGYLRAALARREEILGRSVFDLFRGDPDDPEAVEVRNLRASLERVLQDKAPDAMAVQKFDLRAAGPHGGLQGVRYWVPVNSPVLDKAGEVAFVIHQVQDLTGFVGLPHLEPALGSMDGEAAAAPPATEPEVQALPQDVHEANWLLEKAYQELTKLSEELEARVAERTAQLAEANAQLAEANAQLEAELAERTRLEHQLLHSQKLEAVRRLAGGVAHDFNNLLTILQGYGELLATQSAAGTAQREQLEEITRASASAAVLTRQLLAFSRQQVLDVKVVDLNAVVADVGNMLHRSIGEDIELVCVLDPEGCRVMADPGQMEQILLNMAVNARDAMPQGGTLTIETANVELDESYAREHFSVEPGPYVMLAMADTGMGMDLETQEHIFEPFFSTKDRGKGSGLGLSTVYGVVKQSGGNIWVYSEPGEGATFRIYLPRAAQAVEAVQPAALAEGTEMRLEGTETILLVEDEEGVRSLIRKTLQSKGYTVLEARQSSDALEILQQAGHPIDLVLTDVVLPGMSGPQLAETVKATHPDTRLLYMSGYADDTLLHHGVLEPGKHFIQKPFSPVDLVRKIREVMDAPPADF